MRNKILIYNDYGTNDTSYLQNSLKEYFKSEKISISTISADEIIQTDKLNDEVLAFFMPGGRATPYMEKLKHRGNQKISEYVANGGVYFGICAGAYYASRKVYFETDIKETSIIQQCGLNLIDADAVGTLRKELNLSPYGMNMDCYAAPKIRWLADNEIHHASYHGGPYFVAHGPSKFKVLAEYIINNQKLPAAVMQSHGKGFAIASGIHIEYTGKSLRMVLENCGKITSHARQMLQDLEQNEPSRQALFNKMMQNLQNKKLIAK